MTDDPPLRFAASLFLSGEHFRKKIHLLQLEQTSSEGGALVSLCQTNKQSIAFVVTSSFSRIKTAGNDRKGWTHEQ